MLHFLPRYPVVEMEGRTEDRLTSPAALQYRPHPTPSVAAVVTAAAATVAAAAVTPSPASTVSVSHLQRNPRTGGKRVGGSPLLAT